MDRLQLIAADLAPPLAAASQAQRAHVAMAVARWVTTQVQLIPLEVVAILDGPPSSQLNEIVERLDDEYLSLQVKEEAGECSDSEVLAAFSRVRAASCVAFAKEGDPNEAIYEAAAATDDMPAIRAIVLQSLNEAA